ncbi:PPOX class F420-dependent oxidoreductase [Amycolatopsis pigmentata]|uniref:PPOX class F420-dependent oxidoreductase n=1 Tax=Amycolatopsis pigmentata TaxID=450801 RepID=A0ABW5FUI2_9PSEU
MSEFQRLSGERYVVLTTYRRNGDPVETPVWVAGEGGELVVWTERQSGKVKRIRRDPAVRVQAGDLRGRSKHGAAVAGRARVLDDAGSELVRRAIVGKYGLLARVTMFFSRLRGGSDRTVGLAIALDD